MKTYTIPQCSDFTINGNGDHKTWTTAPWHDLLPTFGNTSDQLSRCKLLYSTQGIYAFFEREDQLLQSSGMKDGDRLYDEDVFEIFLQANEAVPIYFEYEASPLGAELALLIPNVGTEIMGWSPWEYSGERRCQLETCIHGGDKTPGAQISGWSAEVFIPFALFKGIATTPQSGTQWRGNMYRIDYDTNNTAAHWNWSPVQGPSFHDYKNFGRFVFE